MLQFDSYTKPWGSSFLPRQLEAKFVDGGDRPFQVRGSSKLQHS
ncbi:hypothetical protein [[Limnothrix rosea] IAM M-220]|nr:hypothetical protein [[Limnothrix rosea] IAM M-220]